MNFVTEFKKIIQLKTCIFLTTTKILLRRFMNNDLKTWYQWLKKYKPTANILCPKIKIRQYGCFKKNLRPDWMKSHIQMVPFI